MKEISKEGEEEMPHNETVIKILITTALKRIEGGGNGRKWEETLYIHVQLVIFLFHNIFNSLLTYMYMGITRRTTWEYTAAYPIRFCMQYTCTCAVYITRVRKSLVTKYMYM